MKIELTVGHGFAGADYHLRLNGKWFTLIGICGGSDEDENKARAKAVDIIYEQTGEIVNLDKEKFVRDGTF